ncbi:MAG: sialate O-acetylesterase [Kiritimatiellae bacterium]|nr:sialate O-acetylesterase [Kiritimatiellia bacterium]
MAIRLAGLFVEHAVLQRDIAVPVWGCARPGARVRVELGGCVAETVADTSGRFMARLPPMPAGGPFELIALDRKSGDRIVVPDVWLGEVWLCSGQSNMEFTLGSLQSAEEIERMPALPLVRMFGVPHVAQPCRQNDVSAAWQPATVPDIATFSAVAYFFGARLHRELGVAVGLLNSSWGGTRIEAWMSREALMLRPDTRLEVESAEAAFADPAFLGKQESFKPPDDPGNGAEAAGWAATAFDDRKWRTMKLPRIWQHDGHNYSGVFWFRREVEIPAAWAGRELQLNLGSMDKTDVSYFNGRRIGATGEGQDLTVWNKPRVYRVPADAVRAGRAAIAVRVFSFMYGGGMTGPEACMYMHPADEPSARVPLAGDWRYAVEHNLGLIVPPALPPGPDNPNTAGILYDSMIAPLLPYALRGAIWYQGESNADDATAARYGRMLNDLMDDWWRAWGQGPFAFLTVQLANYMAPRDFLEGSLWALVRDGQLKSLARPQAGLAVTIDIGDPHDIHPRNKWDVGGRLAQWALARTYGRPLVASGPLYDGMTIERGRVRIRFRHTGGGLVAKSGALRTFVVAGKDRQFLAAEARIEGDTVTVSHPDVPLPVAVRYAWAENPAGCNLYNAAGLPASPFRTDDW